MPTRVLIATDFVAPPGQELRTAVLLAVNRFSDKTATILAQHDARNEQETEALLGQVLGEQLKVLETTGYRVVATVERGLSRDETEPPYTEILLTQNLIGMIEARFLRVLGATDAANRLGIQITELISLQWHADRIYRNEGGYVSPFTKFYTPNSAA